MPPVLRPAPRAGERLPALRRVATLAALLAAAASLPPAAARAQPGTGQRSATPAPGPAAAATVVLVMRHAERADAGAGAGNAMMAADPGLSAAGVARARAFAEALREGEVSAVYVTQYRRTRDTGAPIAGMATAGAPIAGTAGVPVIERPVSAANAAGYGAALAREIRERHGGRTVAVVGHSNTVPEIVAALSGRPAPALTERDYGDVFVVILAPGSGAARVLRLRAGT